MSESVNDKLLTAIKARREKQTEFNYGILTADRYVRGMQECVGLDVCYRYAAQMNRQTSFDDVLRKAAKTLVYSNQDMVVEQKAAASDDNAGSMLGKLELPKNTLMVFKHVLSTPRKDRDGDVLRSQGAIIDPKMLLLWQHVPTLPIGKMLAVAEQNASKISLVSAIVDMNELCHDAAVMVDNDMARFSHGFRALEFTELKEDGDDEFASPGGFDVKKWEVLEASIVSIPSNVTAEVEEVMLSLVEGGKLTSGMMKEYGKHIRAKRPVSIAAGIDVKELDDADEPGDGSSQRTGEGQKHEGCTCGGASKEAAASTEQKEAAGEPEVKSDAVAIVVSLPSSLGGYAQAETTMRLIRELAQRMWPEKEVDVSFTPPRSRGFANDNTDGNQPVATKAGRALSKSNESKIRDAKEDCDEASGMDMPRSCKALVKQASRNLGEVLASLGSEDEEKTPAPVEPKAISVAEAIAIVLAGANPEQRKRLAAALKAMETAEELSRKTAQYRAFVGAG